MTENRYCNHLYFRCSTYSARSLRRSWRGTFATPIHYLSLSTLSECSSLAHEHLTVKSEKCRSRKAGYLLGKVSIAEEFDEASDVFGQCRLGKAKILAKPDSGHRH
jgi:hypothetical protein